MDQDRINQLRNNWENGVMASRYGDGDGSEADRWRHVIKTTPGLDPAMLAAFERGVRFGLAAWTALGRLGESQVVDLDDPPR